MYAAHLAVHIINMRSIISILLSKYHNIAIFKSWHGISTTYWIWPFQVACINITCLLTASTKPLHLCKTLQHKLHNFSEVKDITPYLCAPDQSYTQQKWPALPSPQMKTVDQFGDHFDLSRWGAAAATIHLPSHPRSAVRFGQPCLIPICGSMVQKSTHAQHSTARPGL